MEGRCAKHQFESAEDVCRACGNQFCTECLVYSFGPKKPPYCIACALAVAGVRTTAGNRPAKDKKEIKKETRQRRKAARESVKNRTASVEIDWSMDTDPTQGITEEDLRLPTAVNPPTPPPPPPPPSDLAPNLAGPAPMGHGDEAGLVHGHVAAAPMADANLVPPPPPPPPPPPMTPGTPMAGVDGLQAGTPPGARTEPPQMLLRNAEPHVDQSGGVPSADGATMTPPAPPFGDPATPGPASTAVTFGLDDFGPTPSPFDEAAGPAPAIPTFDLAPEPTFDASPPVEPALPTFDLAPEPSFDPVPPPAPAIPTFDAVPPGPRAGTPFGAGPGGTVLPPFDLAPEPTLDAAPLPAPASPAPPVMAAPPQPQPPPPPPPPAAPPSSPPATFGIDDLATATAPRPPPPPPPPPARSHDVEPRPSVPPAQGPAGFPFEAEPPASRAAAPPPPPPPAPAVPAPPVAARLPEPKVPDVLADLPPIPRPSPAPGLMAEGTGPGSGDFLPVPMGPRESSPLPPPPPLEPVLPPNPEFPRIDPDTLFLPASVSVPEPAAIPEPVFDINDVPWASDKPVLRVRDLLADDGPEPKAPAEPSFFAPVTPEQLGEDPWPPPPPPPPR